MRKDQSFSRARSIPVIAAARFFPDKFDMWQFCGDAAEIGGTRYTFAVHQHIYWSLKVVFMALLYRQLSMVFYRKFLGGRLNGNIISKWLIGQIGYQQGTIVILA